MHPRSLPKRHLHPLQLPRIQQRLPANARGCLQCCNSRSLPLVLPTRHTHPAYFEFARDRSLRDTSCEQSSSLFATTFQGLEVASLNTLGWHGPL